MRRRDLLKRIAAEAVRAGVMFDLVREGGQHSIFRCGGTRFTVPRHSEINTYTAEAIFKDLEQVFGKDWWRR